MLSPRQVGWRSRNRSKVVSNPPHIRSKMRSNLIVKESADFVLRMPGRPHSAGAVTCFAFVICLLLLKRERTRRRRAMRRRRGSVLNLMVTWSFADVTPGAGQSAHSASSRSAHELINPTRVTAPPASSTATWLAWIAALRWNAFSISLLTAAGVAVGLIWIRLVTP